MNENNTDQLRSVTNQVAKEMDMQNPEVVRTMGAGLKQKINQQRQEIIQQAKEEKKLNRAQRRAQSKLLKANDKKRYKNLMRYLTQHPEAIKVDLDEEKLQQVAQEEENEQEEKKID